MRGILPTAIQMVHSIAICKYHGLKANNITLSYSLHSVHEIVVGTCVILMLYIYVYKLLLLVPPQDGVRLFSVAQLYPNIFMLFWTSVNDTKVC